MYCHLDVVADKPGVVGIVIELYKTTLCNVYKPLVYGADNVNPNS